MYVNEEFITEKIKNKKGLFYHNPIVEYILTKDNNFLPPEYDKLLTKYYIE